MVKEPKEGDAVSCSDPICIEIKTCKWDMSVSKVYCENAYYPDPEPPQIEREPEVIYVEPEYEQPQPRPTRTLGVHQDKPLERGYTWNQNQR